MKAPHEPVKFGLQVSRCNENPVFLAYAQATSQGSSIQQPPKGESFIELAKDAPRTGLPEDVWGMRGRTERVGKHPNSARIKAAAAGRI
jgi:hypothetical protein